ncbi:hypothetical protein C8Q76DRAFT_754317 [Earliella scabrosa]|nr:hypothetical protein C8Q76DRAFT_754317 [Earliella scabrosa]
MTACLLIYSLVMFAYVFRMRALDVGWGGLLGSSSSYTVTVLSQYLPRVCVRASCNERARSIRTRGYACKVGPTRRGYKHLSDVQSSWP